MSQYLSTEQKVENIPLHQIWYLPALFLLNIDR